MTGVAGSDPGPDPARAWATEHYGFDDQGAAQAAAPTAPHRPSPASRSRGVRLAVAGALASVLVAGFGGAAIAAGAMDGGGDGPGGFDGGPGGPGGPGGFDGFDGGGGGGGGR